MEIAAPRATSLASVLLLAAIFLVLAGGCASTPATKEARSSSEASPAFAVRDPVQGLNKRVFGVSEVLDRFLVRPLARGYRFITPSPLRQGMRNFFTNLRGADSALNGFLQGKPRRGFTDVGRVLVNSTLGLGGLFDPATRMGLEFGDEDFGQTLAVWGYTKSAYVYLPVVGPQTVRDLPALVLRFAWPRFILGDEYNAITGSIDVISLRENALDLSGARDAAALSPYVFTREAYYQRRRFQIYDGKPPVADVFDEFEEFEDK